MASVEDNAALGTRHGVAVTYRFESRGSGSNTESWTEVDAEIPAAYPLILHVYRQRRSDQAKIDRNELVDVQLGDPVFDPLFVIESAPTDVVRLLIDPATRGFLVSHSQIELDTVTRGQHRLLRLAIRGWREHRDEAEAAIETCTRMASRVREAFAATEPPAQAQGSPYRPMVDAQRERDAADARAREIAHVEATRAQRAADAEAMLREIGVCVGLLILSALLVATCSYHSS